VIERKQMMVWALVGISISICAMAFMYFFTQLPTEGTGLGIDNIFPNLDNWDIYYQVTNGLRNPPWSVLVLIPVGSLFDPKAAWGLISFATIAVLLLSVPTTEKRWLFLLSVVLLVVSYPTLRIMADAQISVLVFGGILILLAGYRQQNPLLLAIGILLATAKPQAISLLMPTVGLYVLFTWSPRKWLQAGTLVLAVVIPTMIWKGEAWINALQGTYQQGSIMDMGLNAALNRMDLPSPMIVILLSSVLVVTVAMVWFSRRTLSREKAGMLVAASLLLAPYAGSGILTVLCIGGVALLHRRFWVGLPLFILANSIIFVNTPEYIHINAYYRTGVLLMIWIVLCLDIWKTEVASSTQEQGHQPTSQQS